MKTKKNVHSLPRINKRTIADVGNRVMENARGGWVELTKSPRCLTKQGPICLSEDPFCLPAEV